MACVVPVTEKNIRKASRILLDGGVVVAPTDSVYGLFCDATHEKAVGRVYAIKGRDSSKPLQVAVSKKDVRRYGILSHEAEKIVEAYWPGDVNIVVEKTSEILDYVSIKTVCLTCHANEAAKKLVEYTGKPLVSTSANLSGGGEASRVGELSEKIVLVAGMVLDGGHTKHGRPNTIVELTVKPAKILREGSISRKELEKIVEVE